MLTVENLFSRLARGMLKNTSAVEESNLGEIVPTYHDTILMLANDGLRDIFSKKQLRRLRFRLKWVDGITTYAMEDAGVNTHIFKFPEDDDFDESLFVKFVTITPWVNPTKMRIVPDTSANGLSTPSYNVIRATQVFQDTYPDGLAVVYQALHDQLTGLTSEIHLPPVLEYSLQLYVASRYLSEMGSSEQAKRGDELKASFMREMGEDAAQNSSSTSDVDYDNRFTDRGFV